MTFDDLLAQVLALLQREQRLSYRALQRRFVLEEADLDALKDELIYAKRLVVDDDNRVLVWVGDASGRSCLGRHWQGRTDGQGGPRPGCAVR